jgi:hypothetical protein
MAAKEVIYFRLGEQLPTRFSLGAQVPSERMSESPPNNHHRRCALGCDWTAIDPESSTQGGESAERILRLDPSGTRYSRQGGADD